ncbi:YbhB/YbcL family Raf kinase inhibitor-like protein [Microbaculum marinum]|uniref:YbhB/YbcL family Raf kinase inhibitor-like protein n=1 Tax=Microbaculum marinum TaxID=1764581 RepID=A0AAW9RUV5_9HYPH
MTIRPVLLAAATIALMAAAAPAQAFSIAFDWSGLKSCTSGRPNTVDSPPFRISGLPAGTKSVVFKLVDVNVPTYNHGGGTVAVSQSGQLPRGAFKYKSPCPPNGRHTYEWTATAKDGARGSGKTLGVAKARLAYP